MMAERANFLFEIIGLLESDLLVQDRFVSHRDPHNGNWQILSGNALHHLHEGILPILRPHCLR